MDIVRNRYKILPLEYWMTSDRFFEEEVESGCRVETFVIFNRAGLYYDRLYDICWFELPDGRAFVYNTNQFKYELNSLRVWQKYNSTQIQALKEVIKQRVATKTQKEDVLAYSETEYCRSVRRYAFLWRKRALQAS